MSDCVKVLKGNTWRDLRPDLGPPGFSARLTILVTSIGDVNLVVQGFRTSHLYLDMAPLLTGQEIAKHNTRESCWIIVHGK